MLCPKFVVKVLIRFDFTKFHIKKLSEKFVSSPLIELSFKPEGLAQASGLFNQELQPVVSQMHVGRKLFLDVCMTPHVVAYMCEVCFLRFDALD